MLMSVSRCAEYVCYIRKTKHGENNIFISRSDRVGGAWSWSQSASEIFHFLKAFLLFFGGTRRLGTHAGM